MQCIWVKYQSEKDKSNVHTCPWRNLIETYIKVNGARLDVVDIFVYLGSTVSRDGSLDAEIYSRISKASIAFGKLEKRVWTDRDITINTKISFQKTCVLTVLLYSAETGTIHKRHLKLLHHFDQKCIKWQTCTTYTTLLERAKCPNNEYFIVLNQLRWAGHLVRIEDTRTTKHIFMENW